MPEALAARGRDAGDVARELRLDAGRLTRLLGALAALGVVRHDGDLWHLTDDGRYLAPSDADGHPSLIPYAAHLAELMGTWSRLADVVRGAAPPDDPDATAAVGHAAAASEALGLTEAVLAVLDPPATGRVADLGGGLGHLAEALARRHPEVEVVALDGRTELGASVDLCIIVRVLVSLDDEEVVGLLELARRSLAPGGRLEVFEPELDGSPAAGLSDLLSLARSGGAVRSPDGWRALAARAGLRTVGREPFLPPFVHFIFEPEASS